MGSIDLAEAILKDIFALAHYCNSTIYLHTKKMN